MLPVNSNSQARTLSSAHRYTRAIIFGAWRSVAPLPDTSGHSVAPRIIVGRQTSASSSHKFKVGDHVKVQARTQPGSNRPGGVGRIVQINHGLYDVKYVLGGGEKALNKQLLAPFYSTSPTRFSGQIDTVSTENTGSVSALKVARESESKTAQIKVGVGIRNKSDDSSTAQTLDVKLGNKVAMGNVQNHEQRQEGDVN